MIWSSCYIFDSIEIWVMIFNLGELLMIWSSCYPVRHPAGKRFYFSSKVITCMSFCTAYISIHVLSLSLIEIVVLVLNRDRYFFFEFLVMWLLLDRLWIINQCCLPVSLANNSYVLCLAKQLFTEGNLVLKMLMLSIFLHFCSIGSSSRLYK